MKDHETREQVLDTVREALDSLPENEWMVAVWRMDPNGDGLLCHRTTFDFQKERFLEAVSLLAQQMVGETKTTPRQPPLPLAPFLVKKGEMKIPRIVPRMGEDIFPHDQGGDGDV